MLKFSQVQHNSMQHNWVQTCMTTPYNENIHVSSISSRKWPLSRLRVVNHLARIAVSYWTRVGGCLPTFNLGLVGSACVSFHGTCEGR